MITWLERCMYCGSVFAEHRCSIEFDDDMEGSNDED